MFELPMHRTRVRQAPGRSMTMVSNDFLDDKSNVSVRKARARAKTAAREAKARQADARESKAREANAREAKAREAKAREADAKESKAREANEKKSKPREANARLVPQFGRRGMCTPIVFE